MSGFWLCVGIEVNQSIKELSINDIDLGYSHDECIGKMHIFGPFLETNPLLKNLKLVNCYLSCYDILVLSRYVKNRSTNSIEEINLNNNSMDLDELDDEEMENCFLEILYNLRMIKRLKLSHTGIGQKESIPVAKFLRYYSNNLEELDLSGNDTDRVLLIKALGDNSTLKTLNLGHRSKEEVLNIRKQWVQLICNGSSITSTMKSNHCISSWSEPRDDSRERRRIMTRRVNGIEPVEQDDDTKLLLSSFRLNHKEYSFHIKARYKIMWHHIRGSYNIGGEENISISAMPRIIAFFNVAFDSECRSCHDAASWSLDYRYDDTTAPGYKTSPPPTF